MVDVVRCDGQEEQEQEKEDQKEDKIGQSGTAYLSKAPRKPV